jgi:hypothetical protein
MRLRLHQGTSQNHSQQLIISVTNHSFSHQSFIQSPRSAIVLGLLQFNHRHFIAAVGDFPMAFAAVYGLGAIAALGIGFLALKKAREVNATNLEQEDKR